MYVKRRKSKSKLLDSWQVLKYISKMDMDTFNEWGLLPSLITTSVTKVVLFLAGKTSSSALGKDKRNKHWLPHIFFSKSL